MGLVVSYLDHRDWIWEQQSKETEGTWDLDDSQEGITITSAYGGQEGTQFYLTSGTIIADLWDMQ